MWNSRKCIHHIVLHFNSFLKKSTIKCKSDVFQKDKKILGCFSLWRSAMKHCLRRPTMVGNILRPVLQLLLLGKPAIIFEKLN